MFNIGSTCPKRLHLFEGNPESLHEAGAFESQSLKYLVSKHSFNRGLA